MKCQRCGVGGTTWGTVEVFSRVGNFKAVDMCQTCTLLAMSYVLNQPFEQEDPLMQIMRIMPLNDPEDIDDAEHPENCGCPECVADFRYEQRRDERAS